MVDVKAPMYVFRGPAAILFVASCVKCQFPVRPHQKDGENGKGKNSESWEFRCIVPPFSSLFLFVHHIFSKPPLLSLPPPSLPPPPHFPTVSPLFPHIFPFFFEEVIRVHRRLGHAADTHVLFAALNPRACGFGHPSSTIKKSGASPHTTCQGCHKE